MWVKFPSFMVILGGGFNEFTIRSMKRKFDVLIDANSNQNVDLNKF